MTRCPIENRDEPRPHARPRPAEAVVLAGAVMLATVAALVSAAAPAWGHAAFVSSQPEPGSRLSATPGVVTLRFDEPLIPDLSHATVVAPTGEEFGGGPVDDDVIRVEVTSAAQGDYTVEWKTVSPLDGHTLRGSFQFGVGTDVGRQPDLSDAPASGDLLTAIGRTVEYLGLLATLGWLSLAALARSGGSGWVPTGLAGWVALAFTGGVATVAGELLLASNGALAATLRSFFGAGSGPPRLARLAAEALTLVVVVYMVRRTGDATVSHRSTRVLVAMLTAVALLLLSAAGHAGAGGWLAVLAGAGHLVAAGVWAGTIVVLATQRPPGGWRGESGRRMLAAFAPTALIAFGVTVLLGTVRGTQELARLSDLWQTGYGATLAVKVLLVALMVPMSVRAWRGDPGHRRSEAALAVGVVVLAAVLAAYPVPPGRVDDSTRVEDELGIDGLPRPGDLTLGSGAGSTAVGLTIRPGEPGVNDVYVFLVPRRGPEEAGEFEVSIDVEGTGPAGVRRCGVACRTATVSLEGGEEIEVGVVGDGGGATSFVLPGLPAPDGAERLAAMDDRMARLDAFAYDEVFGPHDPPALSSWRVVAPDRLHGVIRRGDTDYRETMRIEDRRWNRDDPDGPWEGGAPGGVTVTANQFIWDQEDRTAIRIVGSDTIDGVETRVLSFFVDSSGLPIWYRLWVDDDHLVHQAEMRTQGHFMDHRYHRFDADIDIRPPDR